MLPDDFIASNPVFCMITIRIDQKDPSLLSVSFPKDSQGKELISEVPGRRCGCHAHL